MAHARATGISRRLIAMQSRVYSAVLGSRFFFFRGWVGSDDGRGLEGFFYILVGRDDRLVWRHLHVKRFY